MVAYVVLLMRGVCDKQAEEASESVGEGHLQSRQKNNRQL